MERQDRIFARRRAVDGDVKRSERGPAYSRAGFHRAACQRRASSAPSSRNGPRRIFSPTFGLSEVFCSQGTLSELIGGDHLPDGTPGRARGDPVLAEAQLSLGATSYRITRE